MNALAPFNAVRLFAAVVAIGGLQHWLAAGAEAGCGDYVHVQGLHVDAAGHGLLDASGSHASGERGLADLAPNRETPCRGPQCSKRSAPPVEPSPAPAASVERHDWSCAAPAILLPSADLNRFFATEARPHSLFRSAAIFRPPRFAAPARA